VLRHNGEPRRSSRWCNGYGGYPPTSLSEDLVDGRPVLAYKFYGEDLDPGRRPSPALVAALILEGAKWVNAIVDDTLNILASGRAGLHMYGDHGRAAVTGD